MDDLPGFKIVRELGHGGMANVYLAIQESLGRQVALKIMSPSLSADPSFKERFLNEGRIIARLNHPHIVTIYDIGYSGDRYFIAMEYIRQGNLRDRIVSGLEPQQAIAIARQIARALGYAHRQEIIHRDIKPLNILFREDGAAVLTDFGIAKAAADASDLTRTGMTIGTPSYMSPEQARSRPVDGRSDLYSLGVVFFEMLTGTRPYKAEDSFATALMHVSAPIPTLPEPLAFVQPVIDRIMAKEPSDRYPDADAFVHDLDRLAAQLRAPTPDQATTEFSLAEDDSRTRVRAVTGSGKTVTLPETVGKLPGWALATVGAVLLLVVGGGGWYWLTREPALDPQTQRMVELLLDRAEKQFSAQRHTAPEGDNALQTYREVLQLVPEGIPAHSTAMQGLRNIARNFEIEAQAQLDRGELERALATVERGLVADPEYTALVDLKKRLGQKLEITRLLALAEQQAAASHYTAPDGDNAFETYKKVLAIDPDNRQATQGLQKIADWFVGLAGERFREGSLESSLLLVAEGLRVDPAHQGLNRLRNEIEQRKEEEKRRAQVTEWLGDAKRQFDAWRLTEPPGDNALESYRQVLSADPDNEQARSGLDQVQERILSKARSDREAGQAERALAMIRSGLRAFPGNPVFVKEEAELVRAIEEETRQQRIAQLLGQAKAQQAAGRLVLPAGDNAMDSYREILSIEPGNTKAEAGLEAIGEHFEKQARAANGAGDLSQALTLVESGLKARPDSKGLRGLKGQLEAQLQDLERRQREIVELLAQARRLEESSQLIAPAGANALESYRAVLGLDSGNQAARDGLGRILAHFAEQARAARARGDLEASLRQIEDGLKVDSGSAELLALKQTVSGELRSRQELQQNVQNLLGKAEDQFSRLRYLSPQGDNALESYRAVLALAPGNEAALAGIQRIAERYLELAQQKRRAGDLEAALKLVESGLSAVEAHAGLLELKQGIAAQLGKQKEHQQQVTALLAQAQRQAQAGRRMSPPGDNAYETYRQLLALDSGNEEALAGLKAIADHFARLAREKQKSGDLKESLRLVEEGLRAEAGNQTLLSLRGEITGKVEEQQRRQERIADLLTKSAERFSQGRYASPKGDNAYETYRELLEMDPGNNDALAGIAKIVSRLTELAEDKRRQSDFEASLRLVEEGLRVDARNGVLTALKGEVEQALERQKREQRIQGMLADAERLYGQGRLISPPGANALETYRGVLELQPANAGAVAGIQRIIERFVGLAREKQQQGDFNASLTYIQQGLSVDPAQQDLLALKREVGAQVDRAEFQRKIKTMLDEAEAHLAAARLSRPEGNNALESYRGVLQLDPGNEAAASGITKIAERYLSFARGRQQKGDLDGSLEYIDSGLQAVPDYPPLLALQREIKVRAEEQRQAQKLQGLLDKAERHFRAGRLSEPSGDNAFEAYAEVLAADPGNKQAKQGQQRIFDRYLELAREAQRIGRYEQSLQEIERALSVFPGNPELTQLQAAVRTQWEEAKSRGPQLDELLALARSQVAARKLTLPQRDNAYETYTTVLQQDPGNVEAKQGLYDIASVYGRLAQSKRNEGDLDGALQMIERGLGVSSDHAGLLALRSELQSADRQRQAQQARLEQWLALARRQIGNERLTQPPGDNAYETYQKVLSESPDNAGAREGLRDIANRYEAMARSKRSNGDLQSGLLMVREGLRAVPDHAGLRALQDSLNSQILAEKAAREQEEREKEEKKSRRPRIFGTF